MKKAVLREYLKARKYAKKVLEVETFEEHIENPKLEVKPTKKRASKKKEV